MLATLRQKSVFLLLLALIIPILAACGGGGAESQGGTSATSAGSSTGATTEAASAASTGGAMAETATAAAMGGTTSGKLTLAGSSALLPLMQAAAQQFQAKHPDAQITVTAGGSGAGRTPVCQGKIDIGDSDVPLSDKEKTDLNCADAVQTPVAIQAFAPVANKQGPGNVNARNALAKAAENPPNHQGSNSAACGGFVLCHQPRFPE